MKFVPVDTLAQAWLTASQHLLDCKDWTDTTVVLHVARPTLVRPQDQAAVDILDDFLVSNDQHGHHTVAETIFPGYEYVTHGVEGVYTNYPEHVFPAIKKHEDTRPWGTYAYRLLRRVDSSGHSYNPLKDAITKMRDKGRKRAAYEVGLGFGFDLATYDDDEDRALRMKLPCLSHLSFKVIKDEVHLTAMYRSHYYMHRAFGNLLGLARLQAFVAEQLALSSGPLVCHSTMAKLEHGESYHWKKSAVPKVVEQFAEALEGQQMQTTGAA